MSWRNSKRLGIWLWLLLGACGCQLSSNAQNVDGVRQFQQGQYQSALDRFQRVIAADPNNADAHYNMAATLHDWGRRTENPELLSRAEGEYHRCLDLSPDHVDCYRALAVLLVDTHRRDQAFTLLERWGERSPRLADPKIELARLYEEFGDESVAKQQLARALDVDPGSARAWAAMGRLREQEGRLAQALTNYQNAVRLNRNHPGVVQKIAGLQRRLASTGAVPGPGQPRLTQTPTPWVSR